MIYSCFSLTTFWMESLFFKISINISLEITLMKIVHFHLQEKKNIFSNNFSICKLFTYFPRSLFILEFFQVYISNIFIQNFSIFCICWWKSKDFSKYINSKMFTFKRNSLSSWCYLLFKMNKIIMKNSTYIFDWKFLLI